MSANVNGWIDINSTIVVLAPGDNIPPCAEYLQMVPVEPDNRVVSWEKPDVDDREWIMEAANADPTQTMDILLIGGLPAQDPPQIVLPPGFTRLRIKPGLTQRIYFTSAIGWAPLLGGTLEA